MKKWLKISLWSLFTIGVIVLMVLVQQYRNGKIIGLPEITINVDGEDDFITEKELILKLKRANLIYDGQKSEQVKSEAIQEFLNQITQIKEATVFQQINGIIRIDLRLRKPIARVFNKKGESFYLDTDGFFIKTTPTHTARCLVVTGDIEEGLANENVPEIINNDSLKSIRKLDDVYRISSYVCNDALFHSLIGQIHLEKNGDFKLKPLVGEQVIVFGSAFSEEEVAEKFEKLRVFYKEAIPYEGWAKYEEISLKFNGQIVCKKKSTD